MEREARKYELTGGRKGSPPRDDTNTFITGKEQMEGVRGLKGVIERRGKIDAIVSVALRELTGSSIFTPGDASDEIMIEGMQEEEKEPQVSTEMVNTEESSAASVRSAFLESGRAEQLREEILSEQSQQTQDFLPNKVSADYRREYTPQFFGPFNRTALRELNQGQGVTWGTVPKQCYEKWAELIKLSLEVFFEECAGTGKTGVEAVWGCMLGGAYPGGNSHDSSGNNNSSSSNSNNSSSNNDRNNSSSDNDHNDISELNDAALLALNDFLDPFTTSMDRNAHDRLFNFQCRITRNSQGGPNSFFSPNRPLQEPPGALRECLEEPCNVEAAPGLYFAPETTSNNDTNYTLNYNVNDVSYDIVDDDESAGVSLTSNASHSPRLAGALYADGTLVVPMCGVFAHSSYMQDPNSYRYVFQSALNESNARMQRQNKPVEVQGLYTTYGLEYKALDAIGADIILSTYMLARQTAPMGQCAVFVGVETSSQVGVSMPWFFLLKTGLMSWRATAPSLTEQTHPYFIRSIPSDAWQAKALVDMVANFNWNQVRWHYPLVWSINRL